MTAKQLDTIKTASAKWKTARSDEEKTRKACYDAIIRAFTGKDQHSVTEIHEASGISRPTIYNILIKGGVHERGQRNRKPAEAGGDD